jgi:hypothetical protein
VFIRKNNTAVYEGVQIVIRGRAFTLIVRPANTLKKEKLKVILSWFIGTPYTAAWQNPSDKRIVNQLQPVHHRHC